MTALITEHPDVTDLVFAGDRATLHPAAISVAAGPVEAEMPNPSSIQQRRPSNASSWSLPFAAMLVVAVYVGLPLTLAAQTHLGTFEQASFYAVLALVVAVSGVLAVLRRTASSKTRVASPARRHTHRAKHRLSPLDERRIRAGQHAGTGRSASHLRQGPRRTATLSLSRGATRA